MDYITGTVWLVASTVIAANSLSQEFVGGLALIGILSGVVAAIYTAKTRTERNAYRDQIAIAEGAAGAWKDERDAEVARAHRLAKELTDALAAKTAAESRTDITRLEKQLLDNHRQSLDNHAQLLALSARFAETLQQIASNTAPENR